jgi:hypothetical protein
MPLKITVPGQELYDPEKNLFHVTKEQTLILEHSLVSLSKWEAKWKKPFLSMGQQSRMGVADMQMTPEMLLDYIRCMTLTQNVDQNVYNALTKENLETVVKYMEDPMTATTISQQQKKGGRGRIVTSELIYAWMAILRIPYDPCQKWHINRLLMLIQVTGLEQEPPKKMDPRSVMRQNSKLNAARRMRHHSKG